MEGRSYLYNDVVPCAAMVVVGFTNVVINILYKAASSKGLTYYAFTAYTHALATLSLLPLSVFFMRKNGLPPFKLSFISQLCLLGIVGSADLLCTYKGIELGSPTLSSAIDNLVPAFTFLLAVFFRMEKVALRSLSGQAKIIGTIASVSGATVIVLYKGPNVVSSPQYNNWTSLSHLLQHPRQLQSSQSNWLIAGLLLALGNLFNSLWYIIQTPIMKIYPEEITVTFINNLLVTILTVPICLLAEPDVSSWTLRPSIVLVSVLYTGVFALSFSTAVHTWGIRLKGPVYVAIFRPLSIVIAAIMSAIFLGDALYLGSVIGALILSAGLYAVLWGKSKEEGTTCGNSGPLSGCNVPLLQSHKDEEL